MKTPKFFYNTNEVLLDRLATKERICDELGDKRSKYMNEIAEIKEELSKRGITNFKLVKPSEGAEIAPINPHVAIGFELVNKHGGPTGVELVEKHKLDAAEKRIKELEDSISGTKDRILQAFDKRLLLLDTHFETDNLMHEHLSEVLDELKIK